MQIIFYIWNPWNLCAVLFLEVPAGDEPGQWLMLPLPLPVRLPPVGIVRANHMENVALHEGDAQLSTGNVYVLLWIVVKQGFYMNLGTKENKTLSKYKSWTVIIYNACNMPEITLQFSTSYQNFLFQFQGLFIPCHKWECIQCISWSHWNGFSVAVLWRKCWDYWTSKGKYHHNHVSTSLICWSQINVLGH